MRYGAIDGGREGVRGPSEGAMLARVVTLRFDPVLEGFDDEPLQEFLKAKEVFAIRVCRPPNHRLTPCCRSGRRFRG